MKKVCFSLLSLFVGFYMAHASPMPRFGPPADPCAQRGFPVTCIEGNFIYSIRIEVTPAIDCSSGNKAKSYSAYISRIEKKDINNPDIIGEKQVIENGQFSFKLGSPGSATFKSEAYGLDLTECLVPMNGAFSVGN